MVNRICWRRGNRIGEELHRSIRRPFRKYFFTYTFTCSHKAREDVIELLLKFVVAPKKSYVSRVAVLETSLGT